MKTVEIRNLFLDYFKENGHTIIESAPLVPINDASLLWVNAGVVPLKKYFDGSVVPDSKRLVNSQKCIRTNDIENVGYTSRHHTYFEMLGNFSIGDYFKKEAIYFAFDFLTSEKWLNLPIEKLYMTVYSTDEESKSIWLDLGVEKSHIIPLNGNFWEIGEGPCGPDTEIFYDRGSSFADGGIELLQQDIDNERYVEIWNIVLSQFNSKLELSRDEYPELPSKNIDTGMGLERIACIMQDVKTNFEIDMFAGIITKIEELSGLKYDGQTEFRVIADHIRTICLAISDSALPSNEGRGYVIRRILRRAVRFGKKLGFNEPFMYKIVDTVNQSIPFYDFSSQIETIEEIIKSEELKFYNTLESGEKKLNQFLNEGLVNGENAFILYDTFGFPIELTIEIANEFGVEVDLNEFNKCLENQKQLSRSSRNDEQVFDKQSETLLNLKVSSEFVGYDNLKVNAKIIAIIKNDKLVQSGNGHIGLILDKTPFYAESGGQISDLGLINNIPVINVIKAPHGQHIHLLDSNIEMSLNDSLIVEVDAVYRNKIAVNHSSTHLLNYSLKKHFGNHIKQQGSYVCDTYLRFDFTHYGNITDNDIIDIEDNVSKIINVWENIEISTMNIDDAKKLGAAALFGEKYGKEVRVVKLGDSLELCGGTHIDNFNSIDKFSIVSIESKGSGIFRIVATTNDNISDMLMNKNQNKIDDMYQMINKYITLIEQFNSHELDCNNEINNILWKYVSTINKTRLLFESPVVDVLNTSASLIDDVKTLVSKKLVLKKYLDTVCLYESISEFNKILKEIDKLFKSKITKNFLNKFDIEKYISVINSFKVAIIIQENIDLDTTKFIVDDSFVNNNLDLVFVANISESIIFIAKASDAAVKRGINCGKLVKEASIICGGNGGGRANFAQAGGKNVDNIDDSIKNVYDILNSIC